MQAAYYPEVLQAIPAEGYKVYVYFDDGRIKLYDASELVTEPPFRKLTQNRLFYTACTVINHTLAWTADGTYSDETCLDVDPALIYETSPTVQEPSDLFPVKTQKE